MNQESGNDLISVIVPVYNTKEYLPKCLNLLRGQTYHNIEILLVDDGSTDGTAEFCDKIAKEDERIIVLHKENGGSSSARNYGMARARGAYFGFVDSDDYVDRSMYELLWNAIKRYQVKAAQVGRDEIDPKGNRLPDICVPPEKPECIAPERFMEELLMHRGDCSFCTKLIARELFCAEENPSGEPAELRRCFPEGMLNEDFHFLVQVLGEIGSIVSLPERGYHVNYRMGSNSRKEGKESFSRVFADNVANADMVLEIVKEKYPDLTETAFRFGIVQRLDYMLHIPISQMKHENGTFIQIRIYLRKYWRKAMKNPILTRKNKLYHTVFAIAPKGIRVLHRLLRG